MNGETGLTMAPVTTGGVKPDAETRFCVFHLSLSREGMLSLTKYVPV